MNPVETVARRWHDGSDHAADGALFGSPTCNCLTVAQRIVPMLAEAWGDGHHNGWLDRDAGPRGITALNPYEEAS